MLFIYKETQHQGLIEEASQNAFFPRSWFICIFHITIYLYSFESDYFWENFGCSWKVEAWVKRDIIYIYNIIGWPEQGDQGDQGDQYGQGDPGDLGDQGDKGDQSVNCGQGDQIDLETEGDQPGDQGTQGVEGDQGYQVD